MRKSFTCKNLWIMCFAMALSMIFAFADIAAAQKGDTLTYKINKTANPKNSYLKNGLRILLPPVKPVAIPRGTVPVKVVDEKLLTNVQIYPNPITDQKINLKYMVSRNSNVTIKIVDVLGNDMVTLFSQRVEPGEQKFVYNLGNKVNSGFYFLRIVAGTESVIKRISIL